EREELLEVADRALAVPGEVLRDLRRVLEELDLLLALGGEERAVVELEEVLPAFVRVEEELQPVERPRLGRVDLEDPLEDRDDPIRVLVPLLVEGDGALAELERVLARHRLAEGAAEELGDLVRALDVA